MNTQKHFQLIRRAQRWIAVLSGVVLLAVSTYAQESESKVSIVAPSQTAPEAAHKRCKTAVNCFDAGAYIVTVTDIIEATFRTTDELAWRWFSTISLTRPSFWHTGLVQRHGR